MNLKWIQFKQLEPQEFNLDEKLFKAVETENKFALYNSTSAS